MAKSNGPRCTLTLTLRTELWQEHVIGKKFRCAELMYNNMARHANQCLEELNCDQRYLRLLSEYRACPDTQKGLKYKKQISTKLNKIVRSYKLSEYDFHDYIAFMKNKSFEGVLDINTAQKLATRVWEATEKVLYSNGKEIHFKSAGDIESIEGKNNKSGIKFNSEFRELRFDNLKIPVIVRKKDKYAELMLTHEICYCRILRKPFKNGWRYFLQLVLEGVPEKKPKLGNGNVGIDMGTSTIAAIGDRDGLLVAHGNNMESDKNRNKTVENYNKENCITANKILKLGNQFTTEPMSWKSLQRRSKQEQQSDNKDRLLINEVNNDDADVLKQLSVSAAYIKNKSLAKINKKYNKKNTKKSRKRFGKSLNNHSPGLLEQILIMKLAYFGLSLQYVNLLTYRASQYNPETGEYIKCGLGVRFKKLFDRLIQRDLLSAFLLQNPLDDLTSIDIKAIEQKVNNFIKIHDKVIKTIKNVPNLPCCVGF